MDILCFASADFEEPNWVNAQHLMFRLARRHRVLYVNSLGLRRPRASGGDLRKITRRFAGLWRGLRKPAADRELYVLSPLNLPPGRSALWNAAGARFAAAGLRRHLRRLGFHRPLTWTFLPSAQPLLGWLDLGPIIYHCVDAYEANPGVDRERVRQMESELLARATLVLATSLPLYERLRTRHAAVRLMPNVVDIEAYPPPSCAPPEPADLKMLPHPRIGYVGNLAAYKCDIPLLERAARERPDHAWVFIGAIARGEAGRPTERLAHMANTHFLGEKPRGLLAAYIHHLDVCLIPFADNESTRHSFPLKFFEYLACGKAIVVPPLPSLGAHLREPLVFTYRAPAEFLSAIERARAASAEDVVQARRRLAEENSWNRRMEDLEGLLASLTQKPII